MKKARLAAASKRRTTDAAWLTAFRRRLRRWYRQAARDLPWRNDRDPYRVWVSEVMLQQTQVATVVPYFERFVAAWPTIAALAAATEHDVLRLWEGLGYYRRARNLHRAAQALVDRNAGRLPSDFESFARLPGVGRYTAGAVLSIALDARQPILEANTARLHSRLLAYRGDAKTTAGKKLLWQFAERLLPRRGSGAINQALMELGATICTPRLPRCDVCPVAAQCAAHQQGLADEIPAVSRKPRIEAVREAAVVVRRRGKVLLVRRGETGRWAGMWDFLRFDVRNVRRTQLNPHLAEAVRNLVGLSVVVGARLTTLRHSVTRFRITLDCYETNTVTGRATADGLHAAELHWVDPSQLNDYPLSVTARKISRLVA